MYKIKRIEDNYIFEVSEYPTYIGGVWECGSQRFIDQDKSQYITDVIPPTISVIKFLMLFTSIERIAVKTSTDPIIIDWWNLVNDPRMTEVDLSLFSVQGALDYLVSINLLTAERKVQISTGQLT